MVDDNYFNKTIFSDKHVPLQLTDNEKILIFFKNVRFSSILEFKNGRKKNYASCSGYLYLTNYRLVYRPKFVDYSHTIHNTDFHSFSCSLESIQTIENEMLYLYAFDSELTYIDASIKIHDDKQSNKIFFTFLEKLIKETKIDKPDLPNEVYYYSDALNEKNIFNDRLE